MTVFGWCIMAVMVLIVSILAASLWARWSVDIAKLDTLINEKTRLPTAITLQPDVEKMSDMGPDNGLVDAFELLGYSEWRAHVMPEVLDMPIKVGHHADGTLVVLHDHPASHAWFDVIAVHDGLHTTTVSNNPTPHIHDTPPGDVDLHDKSHTPKTARDALLIKMATQRPPLIPLSATAFAAAFCAVYRRKRHYMLVQPTTSATVSRALRAINARVTLNTKQEEALIALMDRRRQMFLKALLWEQAKEGGVFPLSGRVLVHGALSQEEAARELAHLWDNRPAAEASLLNVIPPGLLSGPSVRALPGSPEIPPGLRLLFDDESIAPSVWVLELDQ